MDKLVNEQNRDVQNNRSQMTSEVRRHGDNFTERQNKCNKKPSNKDTVFVLYF